jgi:hypothetical protein
MLTLAKKLNTTVRSGDSVDDDLCDRLVRLAREFDDAVGLLLHDAEDAAAGLVAAARLDAASREQAVASALLSIVTITRQLLGSTS